MNENLKDKKNEINFPELMKEVLNSYLSKLNNEYIKYISNKIMNNFLLYKQKMISKKLNNIFYIYLKQEFSTKRQKLYIWKQNSLNNISKINFPNNSRENYFHLNLNVGPIMNNSRGGPIIINNNNSNNYRVNYNTNYNKNRNINNKKYYFKTNYNTIYNNNSSSNISIVQKTKNRPHSSEGPKIKSHIPIDYKGEKNIILQKMRRNKNNSDKIVNKFIKRQEKYSKNN